MSHARAAVAGMLSLLLAADVLSDEYRMTEDELTLWLLILTIIILLVIPDAINHWKGRG